MSVEMIDEAHTTAEDVTWAERALCKGQQDLFFPPFAERPQTRVKREAKARAICAQCPVMEPCRAFGRLHHEYGMWGGENEEERVLAGYALHAPIGTRHLAAIRREAQHAAGPQIAPAPLIATPHAEAS
ncbi:MAG: WhiB family transcriptional regulator [Acidimicrobiia bacterium]